MYLPKLKKNIYIKFMKFAAFSSKNIDFSATLFTYGRSDCRFIDLRENLIPDNAAIYTKSLKISLGNFWLKKAITNLAKKIIKFVKFAAFSSRWFLGKIIYLRDVNLISFIDLWQNI